MPKKERGRYPTQRKEHVGRPRGQAEVRESESHLQAGGGHWETLTHGGAPSDLLPGIRFTLHTSARIIFLQLAPPSPFPALKILLCPQSFKVQTLGGKQVTLGP